MNNFLFLIFTTLLSVSSLGRTEVLSVREVEGKKIRNFIRNSKKELIEGFLSTKQSNFGYELYSFLFPKSGFLNLKSCTQHLYHVESCSITRARVENNIRKIVTYLKRLPSRNHELDLPEELRIGLLKYFEKSLDKLNLQYFHVIDLKNSLLSEYERDEANYETRHRDSLFSLLRYQDYGLNQKESMRSIFNYLKSYQANSEVNPEFGQSLKVPKLLRSICEEEVFSNFKDLICNFVVSLDKHRLNVEAVHGEEQGYKLQVDVRFNMIQLANSSYHLIDNFEQLLTALTNIELVKYIIKKDKTFFRQFSTLCLEIARVSAYDPLTYIANLADCSVPADGYQFWALKSQARLPLEMLIPPLVTTNGQ